LTGPSFEFVAHTADIAVRLTAPSVAGLFEAAAAAFTEAVTNRGTVRAAASREIQLVAPELDLLLVDWLNELLFLFETEDLLVARATVDVVEVDDVVDVVDVVDVDEAAVSLRATVWGERRDASRHWVKVLVKGATYHGLAIERAGEGYVATVIFDI
jgi:SHS2 domain-containing protein